jgi:hypothetical protein
MVLVVGGLALASAALGMAGAVCLAYWLPRQERRHNAALLEALSSLSRQVSVMQLAQSSPNAAQALIDSYSSAVQSASAPAETVIPGELLSALMAEPDPDDPADQEQHTTHGPPPGAVSSGDAMRYLNAGMEG